MSITLRSKKDDESAERPWYTAFAGHASIAKGNLEEVVRTAKKAIERGEPVPVVVLEDATSDVVEIDFGGAIDDIISKLLPVDQRERSGLGNGSREKRGPGRPKLGVVSREVTLLPRHWDWLDEQPGGASVALRRLVEFARRENAGRDRVRRSQEAVHRFMWAMTGDLPGFEEASRAFYRKNQPVFEQSIAAWPEGVREHLRKLVARAREDEKAAAEQG